MTVNNQKLTIVTINYNSTRHLIKLIESVKIINKIVGEIIVIDNNSTKFNKNHLPQRCNKIAVIINRKNMGFAYAMNQGIKKAKYKTILALNPDCQIIDNSIINMFTYYLNEKNIGAIGGKIYDPYSKKNKPTANNYPSFFTALFEFTNLKKIFFNNYFTRVFWPEINNKCSKPLKVISLCGAFLMFRKNLNTKLNLFDQNYFLYLEDLDFCINTIKSGYDVVLYPKSSVNHVGGASSNSIYRIDLKNWYKSRKYFFCKHQGKILGSILFLIFSIEELILDIYHSIINEPTH